MLGIIVAQMLRRKMKMTITTRRIVMSSVNWTSEIEARIVCVRSLRVKTLIAGGIVACSLGSASLILSTVSMTFAPGCLKMTRTIARFPSAQPACVVSCGPLTARPMSRTRSGAPFRYATITSFQSFDFVS